MERKNILLLRAGFHKEFALKSLIEEGFGLIIIDEPNSKLIPFAHNMYSIDSIWNQEEVFEVAKKAYIENHCSGVLSFLDSSTVALGKISDYLGLNYYSEEDGRILANKVRVREMLESKKLNNVRFKKVHTRNDVYEAIDEFGLPAVIKPSDRSASKGVIILRTRDDVDKAYEESFSFSKNRELLIEEYVEGCEYCVELMIINSTPYIMAVSEKEVSDIKYCVELKDITPARISLQVFEKIKNYLYKVIVNLGFCNGIIHIEIKIQNEKIKIIEINPRCAGGNLLESIYHLSKYNPYVNLAYLSCGLSEKVEIPKPINYETCGMFTLYDTFSYSGEMGIIQSIKNMSFFDEIKKNSNEKFLLYIDKGDLIGKPRNNEDCIGSIYLFDESYNNLLERCNKIKNSLEIVIRNA
ncbi:ATP-grasp domain-containing protein [uncultured Clostridium sp.]|uniref:ATP-grasp domain-containing protein n=1 Tax=uncultured Clostridium sp. TaxID=59620 RepID=UPI001434E589|nr:ATP-grasp domain-containing protein [uncultured Clostridium sp.]GFI30812.1 carbamoyl-phosphate synthase large chain [Lachnospiraceae bacterium]